jgi:hypothetical protein
MCGGLINWNNNNIFTNKIKYMKNKNLDTLKGRDYKKNKDGVQFVSEGIIDGVREVATRVRDNVVFIQNASIAHTISFIEHVYISKFHKDNIHVTVCMKGIKKWSKKIEINDIILEKGHLIGFSDVEILNNIENLDKLLNKI